MPLMGAVTVAKEWNCLVLVGKRLETTLGVAALCQYVFYVYIYMDLEETSGTTGG